MEMNDESGIITTDATAGETESGMKHVQILNHGSMYWKR